MSLLSVDSPGSLPLPCMDRVEALYRIHVNFVWRVLSRRRVPAADVADLAHDVFVTVLRKLSAEDPPLANEDQERAWLCRIAIHVRGNYLRRARYRRMVHMDNQLDAFSNPQNDHERLEDMEMLELVLEAIEHPVGRELFELVDLEGFSLPQAAVTLDLKERTAQHRLALAREDVNRVVTRLRREEAARSKKKSTLLMAFGVVPWVQLRSLHNPPAGTVDEVWARLQATMTQLDRENVQSAPPRVPGPHTRSHPGRLMRTLAGTLKSPWFNLVSACLGGAIVALLLHLRPNTKLMPVRFPVPIALVTTSSATRAPVPGPSAPPVTLPTGSSAHADEAMDEESAWIRRIRADITNGNRKSALDALTEYEQRFPTGRLKTVAQSMRASLAGPVAR